IHSITLLLPAWKLLLQEQKCAVRIMLHDVATQWNSTFNMLWFAIDHRHTLEAMTRKHEHNLRMFELSGMEWQIASELCNILQDAMTYFSHLTPNLATVIPAINHIDAIFTSHQSNELLNGAVCSAFSLGKKKTLDHYYSLTDSSDAYQIAMGKL
ncbi:hypothetical protein DFH29DRAFT_789032, partial [Suillus ampliporus]